LTEQELSVIKNRAHNATRVRSVELALSYYHVKWGKRDNSEDIPDDTIFVRKEDALFLGYAREDVLTLVAEVERLRKLMQDSEATLARRDEAQDKKAAQVYINIGIEPYE